MTSWLDQLLNPIWVQFGDQWVKVLTGVDLPMNVAFAAITFILFRNSSVDNRWAHCTPWVLGSAWGGIVAYDEGYSTLAYLVKGIVINGFVSWVVAWTGHIGFEKILVRIQKEKRR